MQIKIVFHLRRRSESRERERERLRLRRGGERALPRPRSEERERDRRDERFSGDRCRRDDELSGDGDRWRRAGDGDRRREDDDPSAAAAAGGERCVRMGAIFLISSLRSSALPRGSTPSLLGCKKAHPLPNLHGRCASQSRHTRSPFKKRSLPCFVASPSGAPSAPADVPASPAVPSSACFCNGRR